MATDQCTVEREMIQDIYPCTPFQENTMAFTMRKQCLFVARAYYTLPIDVGIESVESDAKDVPQVLSEGQMRDILTRGGCILEQVLPQRGQLSDITQGQQCIDRVMIIDSAF
ncbi:hypothetical protein ASPWEDRAFT_662292 [Aspergillus wentii DTO 134E9]|uniref:Uncharacterized protein n=1 Tax=Aspergillus wentii DTO 134E9 TaxID=1073089 RepID=A0A1L9RBZ4_ASPWE|nr:uncharacterized protein ASPWEDRAFT_662292 [Aspergillus wentii DTO 134E9]OJJ32397.1 hypothetical protein ASPWEDRAFT_662292 [Aspergillus wentii DTO 134E9]